MGGAHHQENEDLARSLLALVIALGLVIVIAGASHLGPFHHLLDCRLELSPRKYVVPSLAALVSTSVAHLAAHWRYYRRWP